MRIANIQLALAFTAEKWIFPEAFRNLSQVKSTMVPLFTRLFKGKIKTGELGVYSFVLETDNVKAEGLNSD